MPFSVSLKSNTVTFAEVMITCIVELPYLFCIYMKKNNLGIVIAKCPLC